MTAHKCSGLGSGSYDEVPARRSLISIASKSLDKPKVDKSLSMISSSCSLACLNMEDTFPPKDADEPMSIFSHSEKLSITKRPLVLPTIKNRRNTTSTIVQSECSSIKKTCVVAQFHFEAAWKSCIEDNVDKESVSCRESHIDIACAQPKSSSTLLSTFPGHHMNDVISCLVGELELNYPHPSISSKSSSIYDPVRLLRDPASCDPPKTYTRKMRQP